MFVVNDGGWHRFRRGRGGWGGGGGVDSYQGLGEGRRWVIS